MAPAGKSSATAVKKGEGPDRGPSEVFNGPAHRLNLGVNQSVFVNDQKKRELEDAFPGEYAFTLIEHHGTLNPIEGDHEIAWEARNAADVVDTAVEAAGEEGDEAGPLGKVRGDTGLPSASDDAMTENAVEPEGLKDAQDGVVDQPAESAAKTDEKKTSTRSRSRSTSSRSKSSTAKTSKTSK